MMYLSSLEISWSLAISSTTFSNVAASGLISVTILSIKPLVLLQISSAYTMSNSGVSLKLGRAWGGLWYLAGTIVGVVVISLESRYKREMKLYKKQRPA